MFVPSNHFPHFFRVPTRHASCRVERCCSVSFDVSKFHWVSLSMMRACLMTDFDVDWTVSILAVVAV